MSRHGTTIILLVALVLVSCSPSIRVNSDWSPDVDWESFATFAWLPDAQSDGAGPATDQITDRRIRAAVDSVLTDRGLRKVSSGSDLMVGYQVTTRTSVSYSTTATSWGRGGWGGWSGGMTTMRTVPVYSQSGTLLISVYETKDKSLVWHGSGQTDLRTVTDPQERQRRISNVVARTLETLPPPK